jgi:integrase
VPHKLPVILSREEVARLIQSAGNLKYQAALSVAYGAGLRVSEVIALKVGDVDSQRMVLRVEQGKGQKCFMKHLWPYVFAKLMLRRPKRRSITKDMPPPKGGNISFTRPIASQRL